MCLLHFDIEEITNIEAFTLLHFNFVGITSHVVLILLKNYTLCQNFDGLICYPLDFYFISCVKMCDTKEFFLLNLTDSLSVQHFMESSMKKNIATYCT